MSLEKTGRILIDAIKKLPGDFKQAGFKVKGAFRRVFLEQRPAYESKISFVSKKVLVVIGAIFLAVGGIGFMAITFNAATLGFGVTFALGAAAAWLAHRLYTEKPPEGPNLSQVTILSQINAYQNDGNDFTIKCGTEEEPMELKADGQIFKATLGLFKKETPLTKVILTHATLSGTSDISQDFQIITSENTITITKQ